MAAKSDDASAPEVSELELSTKLALLGREDRTAYREVRALLWEIVVARSHHSDKPSNCS